MSRRLLLASSLALAASTSTSCTLAKPIVCALTAPVYVIGNSGGGPHWCSCNCNDARAYAVVVVAICAVGAVGGLVTGIISDINVLRGVAEDPCRNFANPFATNTSGW